MTHSSSCLRHPQHDSRFVRQVVLTVPQRFPRFCLQCLGSSSMDRKMPQRRWGGNWGCSGARVRRLNEKCWATGRPAWFLLGRSWGKHLGRVVRVRQDLCGITGFSSSSRHAIQVQTSGSQNAAGQGREPFARLQGESDCRGSSTGPDRTAYGNQGGWRRLGSKQSAWSFPPRGDFAPDWQ